MAKGLGPSAHHLSQQQMTLPLADARPQPVKADGPKGVRVCKDPFILIDIADGGNARQEQGLSLCDGEKGITHGAAGAAVGQQDQAGGQRQRISPPQASPAPVSPARMERGPASPERALSEGMVKRFGRVVTLTNSTAKCLARRAGNRLFCQR